MAMPFAPLLRPASADCAYLFRCDIPQARPSACRLAPFRSHSAFLVWASGGFGGMYLLTLTAAQRGGQQAFDRSPRRTLFEALVTTTIIGEQVTASPLQILC